MSNTFVMLTRGVEGFYIPSYYFSISLSYYESSVAQIVAKRILFR